jgi:hypothetical protein
VAQTLTSASSTPGWGVRDIADPETGRRARLIEKNGFHESRLYNGLFVSSPEVTPFLHAPLEVLVLTESGSNHHTIGFCARRMKEKRVGCK